ncbi:MAG: DNA polymerase [Treponema sp.]|nr:DNA polymerase [Treponema sp.]
MRAIAHLNIIGFRAAVAGLFDSSLFGRPYVVAGRVGGQAVAWDVSPAALKEGIKYGALLSAARRLVKDLTVVSPDPAACSQVNGVLEGIISRYAPVWQNDGAGNIYLDLTGTRRIFGPASDCVCHIQNEILDKIKIEAAAAAGTNKLVCKVASRTIRPEGLIEVRSGEEASFLSHQDIALLPGLGSSLMKTIRVTGFREAGELAALSDSEALSLFGKKGILLRDSARGIDDSPVAASGKRIIESRADFPQDVIDDTVIKGAVASVCENAGLQMRRDKLGTSEIRFSAVYADGVTVEISEKRKQLLVMDKDLITAAAGLYQKAVIRRVRIRSISVSLENFSPLGYEPDLFEIETETRNRRLQEAADKIQFRYGTGKITRGIVLAASNKKFAL